MCASGLRLGSDVLETPEVLIGGAKISEDSPGSRLPHLEVDENGGLAPSSFLERDDVGRQRLCTLRGPGEDVPPAGIDESAAADRRLSRWAVSDLREVER